MRLNYEMSANPRSGPDYITGKNAESTTKSHFMFVIIFSVHIRPIVAMGAPSTPKGKSLSTQPTSIRREHA